MASCAEGGEGASVIASTRSLTAIRAEAVAALDAAIELYETTMQALQSGDAARARRVGAGADRRHGDRRALHESILALLAQDGARPRELRVIAALLHVIPCTQRIVDECAVMAELVPRYGALGVPAWDVRHAVDRLRQLTAAQLCDARRAFATQDAELAEQLPARAAMISSLNRRIAASPALTGPNADARRLAAVMVVLTNGLAQVSEDAVEIGEQVVSMTSGLFQEIAYGA